MEEAAEWGGVDAGCKRGQEMDDVGVGLVAKCQVANTASNPHEL